MPWRRDDTISVVALLRVRGGFLLGSRSFDFEDAAGEPEERMGSFLRQYYLTANMPPGEIVVNHMPPDSELIEAQLGDRKGRRVRITAPRRGDKEKLVRMALQNAKQALVEQRRLKDTQFDLLKRLTRSLHLSRHPGRIECFDNSSLSGTDAVAAMVVFENGRPQPSAYRRFNIRFNGKPDDYAHMAEVIRRRFQKGDAGKPWPDLLLVDGGKGQLGVARSVLAELGIEGAFDLAGIAKKDPDAGETQDKIYLPGRSNPVQFGRDGDLLLLLQHVRDEAHRCAVGFQRKRRKQRTLHSVFDDIQGIGPKRKALLLKRFGSIENLKSASLAEIQSVQGISRERAAAIKKALS